jgi:hypothetical protein
MPKFVLYRILGNDLPPRHGVGQTLSNLQFILEHELPLADCEKRWVVNRIVDQEQERRVMTLLDKHGQKYIRIPFVLDEYAGCHYDIDGLPRQLFLHCASGLNFPPLQRARGLEYPFRYKNLYVMNNNGARNAALEEGQRVAEWVMPWDGNCFLTRSAWDSILRDMESLHDEKYLIVPMTRVHFNADLLNIGFAPNPVEEPQIVFHGDSGEKFDESKRYGFNPKVELLRRLRVPGPWDNWPKVSWEEQKTNDSDDAGKFRQAGWVARLSSGALESENVLNKRPLSRINGIVRMLSILDEQVMRRKFRKDDLVHYDESVLAASRLAWKNGEIDAATAINDLIGAAETILKLGPFSVLDKTSKPPSGDLHDYLNPAPYWWRDPAQADAKSERHDGKRLPENELYSPESGKYDRTRLQQTFDHTTILGLAWYFTGDARFADQAANIIRTWFLDPATRMNPHLRYAQIRLGEQSEQLGYGIIETKDMYYFLDAVRLVFRSGKLADTEQEQFRQWCKEFLGWLLNSPQGKRVFMAQNNQGTYYDLQVASLAAFLDDTQTLLQILRVSCMRVAQQFQPDGSQPEELKRTNSLHYCVFNLQGWASLARIARLAEMDLWNANTREGGYPALGLSWVLSFQQGPTSRIPCSITTDWRFSATLPSRCPLEGMLKRVRHRFPSLESSRCFTLMRACNPIGRWLCEIGQK